MDIGEPLFTPDQVATLLQISTRTVYDNKEKLGGFYPAGIGVLRFRREKIHGYMEGSRNEEMEVRVSIQ